MKKLIFLLMLFILIELDWESAYAQAQIMNQQTKQAITIKPLNGSNKVMRTRPKSPPNSVRTETTNEEPTSDEVGPRLFTVGYRNAKLPIEQRAKLVTEAISGFVQLTPPQFEKVYAINEDVATQMDEYRRTVKDEGWLDVYKRQLHSYRDKLLKNCLDEKQLSIFERLKYRAEYVDDIPMYDF